LASPPSTPPPDDSLYKFAAKAAAERDADLCSRIIIKTGGAHRTHSSREEEVNSIRTERRNPRSRGLDRKSTLEILRVLNDEDARVASAVRRELPRIARAVEAIVHALRGSGRLFYVGAGTSGRLAVIDAAECAPTFGLSTKTVQAIIAGGGRALRKAVEGEEDFAANGARDLAAAGVKRSDAVVGLSASGTTPYVLGALRLARRKGAVTIGVTSNQRSALAREVHIGIIPDTGAEAITGSTRLKAGTAQKMVLNLLSTAAMTRLGRVYENWMIYVTLSNQKLRRRGTQILEEATGVSASRAQHALRQTRHNLAAALVMLQTGASAPQARRALANSGGNVRGALAIAMRAQRRPNKAKD
jgi:N-acetylmuramic acid 6-phosphate etherase